MKQKVYLSTYSIIVSIICYIVLIGCICFAANQNNQWGIWSLFAVIILMSIGVLFFTPMSISVDDNNLTVNFSIRNKDFPLSQIESVKLCPPTMAEKRIVGSGGFFGYWGWFKERDLGKYFAYYGKASDCFLVTLKNGKKYMLGCNDAPEMVAEIQGKLE